MKAATPIVESECTPMLPGVVEPEPEQHCNGAVLNGHTNGVHRENAGADVQHPVVDLQQEDGDASESASPKPIIPAEDLRKRAKIATLFRTSTRSIADEDENQTIVTATGKVVSGNIASDKNLSSSMKQTDKENRTMQELNTYMTSVFSARIQSKHQQIALSIVNGRFFGSGVACLILLNAIFIGLETDYNDAQENGEKPNLGWVAAETIFTFLFLAELIVRLLSEPFKEFFLDTWNIFDTVIVVSAVVDLVANLSAPTQGENSGAGNLTVLRIFRILRLARIVRLLRVFKELQLLVAGIVGSVRVLGWVWILLIMVIYIFAVFATRTIAHNHRDDKDIQGLIGKLPKSMFTFFVIMTTERWADIARTLGSAEPVSYAVILLFISTTTYAMINVVIAVIVDVTMSRASEIKNDALTQKNKIEQSALVKVMDVFKRADENGDGFLTKDEFLKGLQRPDVRELLFSADVSLRDADELFDILDTDESGSLTCSEFLDGVQRARGAARSKELLEMHCDVWKASGHWKRELFDLKEEVDGSMLKRLQETKSLLMDVGDIRAEFDSQADHFVKALREDNLKASSAIGKVSLSGLKKSAMPAPLPPEDPIRDEGANRTNDGYP